jgi:hypothetical protein
MSLVSMNSQIATSKLTPEQVLALERKAKTLKEAHVDFADHMRGLKEQGKARVHRADWEGEVNRSVDHAKSSYVHFKEAFNHLINQLTESYGQIIPDSLLDEVKSAKKSLERVEALLLRPIETPDHFHELLRNLEGFGFNLTGVYANLTDNLLLEVKALRKKMVSVEADYAPLKTQSSSVEVRVKAAVFKLHLAKIQSGHNFPKYVGKSIKNSPHPNTWIRENYSRFIEPEELELLLTLDSKRQWFKLDENLYGAISSRQSRSRKTVKTPKSEKQSVTDVKSQEKAFPVEPSYRFH